MTIRLLAAWAQEPYPNRPITLVAPFPPGGVADLTARPVAAAMEKVLKSPVVVVNKTGAAGAVGMSFVANSKPDGDETSRDRFRKMLCALSRPEK